MAQAFDFADPVVGEVQHLQLEVELERVDADELDVILLQEQIFKILEELQALNARSNIQERQPQVFERDKLLRILMSIEAFLVVVLQFLLEYLQFLLLHVRFGDLFQIDSILIVETFADFFFAVGVIVIRVLFLVVIAVVVRKRLLHRLGNWSLLFLLLSFLLLLHLESSSLSLGNHCCQTDA